MIIIVAMVYADGLVKYKRGVRSERGRSPLSNNSPLFKQTYQWFFPMHRLERGPGGKVK